MKSTNWGWRPIRPEGIWKHGCKWARPLTVAAPWIALALLLVEFSLIEGRLTAAPGVVFNLPAPIGGESALPGLAAIVVPVAREGATGRETLVFFDDARYSLSDDASIDSFRGRLSVRARGEASGTLLLLADARVPSGDVMRLVGLAREAGVARVQIGERRE
ncbi:MAG: ExbD/TolR family protein [Kiritimatiellia bacterium]